MATVLLISSQVAASRVGASAGQFVLQRMGHETLVLPTVLLGRHPGWGAPGGGAVGTDHLASMWEAVRAQDLHIDAVLTGYFAEPSQVELAARIVDEVRPATVMCDPVIGDDGGLYVAEAVARAIRDRLVPRAHIVTPNLWEFGWLGGDLSDAVASARALARSALVTSWPDGPDRIGALHVDADGAREVHHERFAEVPHGGGDTLAALWLAHHLNGAGAEDALAKSVGSVVALLRGTLTDAKFSKDRGELQLARDQRALIHPDDLEVHHV